MIDAVDSLNIALARVAELETKLDHLIVQVEKVKHLKAGLKIVQDRVVELKGQRDTGRDRIEELEGMLEKAQDHLACAHARNEELEGIESQQATIDLVKRLREVQVSYVPHAETIREAADRIASTARAFATLLNRIAELEGRVKPITVDFLAHD